MSKLKLVLIILGIVAVLALLAFVANSRLAKGTTQKFTQAAKIQSYYWTIAKERKTLTGGTLPDQLRIFTLDNKLVFSSDTVQPMFEGTPKISTKVDQSAGGATWEQIFQYDFAAVTLKVQLSNQEKFADISVETKYNQDKASQFEGIKLSLDGLGKASYFDETYTKKTLAGKVQISQWSPHVVEIDDKYKTTLVDNTAEVMELQKGPKTDIKFYSYFGSTREGVFARNYEGADKADPKIDTNIKRSKGEIVTLSSRLFVSQDSLSYLPFRWPYAKDSVVSLVSHADLGQIRDYENEGVDRINSVFYGSSRTESEDFGKKGILSHDLRVTFTVFPVKDAEENSNNGSTLEASKFSAAVQELYRRGVDIGAHRLAYEGIGEYKNDEEKIKEAFEIMSEFSPSIWIDHRVRDCENDSKAEDISGCGSLNEDKLNVTKQMAANNWKYWWASGQDSQGGGKDYQLNAFEDFLSASRVLYYYQGTADALIPPQLMAFAQSYTYEKKEFSTADLDKLSKDKGFHNVHAYFVANSAELDNSSLKKDGDGNTYWRTSTHLEKGLEVLEDYQKEDLVWVRDFTTVADYLRQWQKIKILDFTANSVTIQNTGEEAIDGLTLYNPIAKIKTVKSGGTYYPYTREGYVVLPRLEKGETKKIEFGDDKNIPQITNFEDKHIDINDVSYSVQDKKLNISIGPSGKPGQDLVINDTEITIELPSGFSPKITRDKAAYNNFSLSGNTLTLKTDTNNHSFIVQF